MPSPHSVWLVSSPLSPSADAGEMLADLEAKLDPSLAEGGSIPGSGNVSGNGKATATATATTRRVTGRSTGSVGRVEWGNFKVTWVK